MYVERGLVSFDPGAGGEAASGGLVASLLAKGAQVYAGPAAKRPPGLRHLGERTAGAVAFGDFGCEPALVLGKNVRRIGAADDNELSGEWPQALDLLHRPDGLVRAERTQGRSVESSVECSDCDGLQILGFAARQVELATA